MDRLFFVAACCLLVHSYPRELYEGSKCRNSDSSGVCTPVPRCPIAFEAINAHKQHDLKRCGFDRFTEIVCCPSTGSRNVIVDDKPKPAAPKGRKAQHACQVYSNSTPIILNYHISGGEHADLGEFPHMAALGFYSVQDQNYKFDCAGTLITNRYIVTAAHCILNAEQNSLKIVRLGALNVTSPVDEPDPEVDYDVENVTVHREYKWKEKFNDIALVKLAKTVTFNTYIKPACLYTKSDDPENLIVTGWGAVALGGDRSDRLQKAKLHAVPLHQCNTTYTSRIKRSIISSQICAADERSDACQGDSGGPLQILTNSSLASVVGITSYGIGCGTKYPGIYTRIYSYLDWIEGIVWP